MAQNATYDGFESNFRDVLFCLPLQLVGLLLSMSVDKEQPPWQILIVFDTDMGVDMLPSETFASDR